MKKNLFLSIVILSLISFKSKSNENIKKSIDPINGIYKIETYHSYENISKNNLIFAICKNGNDIKMSVTDNSNEYLTFSENDFIFKNSSYTKNKSNSEAITKKLKTKDGLIFYLNFDSNLDKFQEKSDMYVKGTFFRGEDNLEYILKGVRVSNSFSIITSKNKETIELCKNN